MSCYFIASYNVIDADKYKEYLKLAQPLTLKHGGIVVVSDPETKALEGEVNKSTVIVKFDSEEKALEWYNDPEYQKAIPLRQAATEKGRVRITREFVMR